jgi:hypothetical protein
MRKIGGLVKLNQGAVPIAWDEGLMLLFLTPQAFSNFQPRATPWVKIEIDFEH